MTYKPQVDDYVIWKNENGINSEGWVYFVSSKYITIEIGVTEKDNENIKHCPIHRNNRCLLLCYHFNWNELRFIKHRRK